MRSELIFAFVAVPALFFAAPEVRSAPLAPITLQRQPLDEALRNLGVQTNTNIVLDMPPDEKRRMVEVVNAQSVKEALTILLSETGLEYFYVNDHTVLVRQKQSTIVPASGKSNAPNQPESDHPSPPPNPPTPPQRLEDITLTGSHGRGMAPGAAPLYVFDSLTIKYSGAGSIAAFLREALLGVEIVGPDALMSGAGSAQTSANRTRGTRIFLHAAPTLVLVNGTRVAPAGTDGSYVDLSMFPLSMVDRIEVITDGASFAYGSDAVGGVVNIILKDRMSGGETSVRYSVTEQGGGDQPAVSQSWGREWGKGGALLIYDYDYQAGIDAAQRDFIPRQAVAFTILPRQRKDGGYLFAHYSPWDSTELSFEGFYTERSFDQDSVFDQFKTHAKGAARQSSASMTLRQSWGSDWHTMWTAHYAARDERADYFSAEVNAPLPLNGFSSLSHAAISSSSLGIDGPLAVVTAGTVKASLGVELIHEVFQDLSPIGSIGTGLDRDIRSVYGELTWPIIGRADNVHGVKQLDLSLALHFDHYQHGTWSQPDFSTWNPRLGLTWSPLENVSVRATHAKSFNAASLAQSSEQGNTLIEVAVPDPNATGSMLNMLEVFGGNSQLRSEAAKSYTLGIDIGRPFLEEGGEISATYYYAEYSNRIGSPPIVGIQTAALEQGASLGPFVQRPPDPEMLAAVSKYQGGEAGLGTIDALYDGRVQNLAVAIFSGFGVSGRYRFMLERSYLDLSFMLDRLLQLEERSAAGADRVNFADTPFNPADLRLRFGSRWSWNQYSLGIRLDYTGSYWDAAINPARKVSSWLTADLLFSMDIDKQAELPAFRNLTLSVNVLNLTDRDPPSVSIGPSGSTLGYDGRNASPLGRSVLLLLGKRW